MSFRIIKTTNHDAYMNMALDEACMQSVKEGQMPTIRLFGWDKPSVTIGCFQCLSDEVDIKAIKEDGVPITRRITGGGAVYHDQEITYSLVAPEKLFSKDIPTSYGQVIKPILKALHKLGIKAKFRPLNDLVYEGKKISGNAQTRKGGVLLQHGTIILSVDEDKMFRYLTPDANKNNDKPYIKSNRSSVRGILNDELTAQQVLDAVRNELISSLQATQGSWSDDEIETARELAKKYRSDEWIALR